MSITSEARLTSEKFANWPKYVPVIEMGIQISDLTVAGFPAERKSDGTNIVLYFLPKVSGDRNSYSSKEGMLVAAKYYCIGRIKDLEWSDAVSRQAGLILSIDETKAKRERDRWEQEKEAEKRREQEEEDARGYDGL